LFPCLRAEACLVSPKGKGIPNATSVVKACWLVFFKLAADSHLVRRRAHSIYTDDSDLLQISETTPLRSGASGYRLESKKSKASPRIRQFHNVCWQLARPIHTSATTSNG